LDCTYVDEKSLTNLEDLAVLLTSALLSLNTLRNIQVQSIKIGLMPEDMNERSNIIIHDIDRLLRLYQNQLEGTLELLPDDFNGKTAIDKLKAKELTKARSMSRRPKEVKNG
jgi:hypothetical protein